MIRIRFLPTCPSSTQAPLTATGQPRRSAARPPRAPPPPRTSARPWSTTMPSSPTSSASPRIKHPDRRSPPRARASSSPHLTRKRWRNDLTKRDGNESDGSRGRDGHGGVLHAGGGRGGDGHAH